MAGQIYDRQPATGLVRDFLDTEQAIEDVKDSQIVGNDNLVIGFYIDDLSGQVVGANTTAVFKATFTFDEPPVNSLVQITMDWFDLSAPPFQYTEQRYDDPATIGDMTKQSYYVVFSPDTTLNVYINAFAKSTSKGTLDLVRVS